MNSAKDLYRFFTQGSVLLSWFIVSHAERHSADTAIQGQIADPSHSVSVGVQIDIENSVSGPTRTIRTNILGSYSFPGLLGTTSQLPDRSLQFSAQVNF